MSKEAKVTEVTTERIPKISPPLEVPVAPPRVGIRDPDFCNLTSAEKLNDSTYRKLVYQCYPDEPTCACEPVDKELDVGKPPGLVCRSGCNKVCCSRMRQSGIASSCQGNANKDDMVAPFIATYCVGNERDNSGYKEQDERRKHVGHNGEYCCFRNRLRGGGEGGERRGEKGMCAQPGNVSGAVVRWLEDEWNGRSSDCVARRRLDGGGGVCLEYAERNPQHGAPGPDGRTRWSMNRGEDSNFNPSSLYRGQLSPDSIRSRVGAPIASSCCCPGKETFLNATKNPGDHEPLPVIDSLVRSFRETQQFVDSLGKVPGLPGLGLMDPAESPYFGRMRKMESDLEKSRTVGQFSGNLPNPQCTGACNAPVLRPLDGVRAFGTGVPGRGGIIREAVPAMPEAGLNFAEEKLRKKEDEDKPKESDPDGTSRGQDEPSPCGEASCKSKRRKKEVPEESAAKEKTEDEEPKKTVTLGDRPSRQISRAIRKFNSPQKPPDGHGTDRRKSSGKSGRKMISFVYSAGNKWTGEGYGHKKCVQERRRIPANMGWLWNLNETVGRLKPRRAGWRPGAIGRRVREVLREAEAHSLRKARSAFSARVKSKSSRSSGSRSRSGTPSGSRGKSTKPEADHRSVKRKQVKGKEKRRREETEPPPTLYIHRKDGTYYVTMYPIKQDTMDVPKLEEPMKPLQFKIARNRDDASIASSSTASDMEIEFSPPAAVNRYRRKPNVIHINTQVKQHEIIEAFKKTEGAKVITVRKRSKIGKK